MNFKLNFCFILVLLAALALASHGQRVKAPQNVFEYYMALPEKYMGNLTKLGDRKKNVEIKDIENGYLRLTATELEGYGEAALFKNADGTKTFAIQTVGCGPVCGTDSIYFLQYKNGRWIDVTRDVLPEVSEAELNRVLKCLKPDWEEGAADIYKLPRYGTTVQLLDNSDAVDILLYELTWDGKKFTARAKRDKACKEQ